VLWVVLGVVLALAVASVAEINAQSAPYRQMTDRGYGELASRVVVASNQTGSDLAELINQAPSIPNAPWSSGTWVPSLGSNSARVRIQQGLDQAVAAADQQSAQASQLAPPGPADSIPARFASVLAVRATTVTALRATLDQLLGMAPLPVAGAPTDSPSSSTTDPADGAPRLSISQASTQTAAEGSAFVRADANYAGLAAMLRSGKFTDGPVHLPASVWAAPGTPLSPVQLTGTPALLGQPGGSAALVPYHQLVITAVGLVPAAIPSATPNDQSGSGIVGVSCSVPNSTLPGIAPTVMPPTKRVSAQVTVTNCGTVTEANIPVTETLALDDPAGTAAPPAGSGGGASTTEVTLLAGGSEALSLGTLSVAAGHTYRLTIALTLAAPPSGPTNLAGTSQAFVLQIPG